MLIVNFIPLIILTILLLSYSKTKAYTVSQNLITFQYNQFTITYIFNNNTYSTDRVALAYVNGENVYFVSVPPTASVQNVVCRQQSQEKVIIGPIGCSNTIAESSNCGITSEPQLEEFQSNLQKCWWLSATSDECFLNGCDGNVKLCQGDVRLAGIDYPFDPTNPTVKELIGAQMVYINTVTDPLAAAQSVIEMNIEKPKLGVTTTCSSNYNQNYTSENTDVYPLSITGYGIGWIFNSINLDGYRVVLRSANNLTNANFIIEFAKAPPTGSDFIVEYVSTIQNVTELDIVSGDSWVDLLITNQTYYFNNSLCTAIFSEYMPSSLWNLLPYPLPTPETYMLNENVEPRRYMKTSPCNFAIGRLTSEDGNEYYPFTPEGSLRGGYPLYEDPQTGLPIGVRGDPTLAYRFTCEELYPKNQSFGDLNGSPTQRMSIPSQSCYFPFLINSLVLANLNPREAQIQCVKQGGYTIGNPPSYCGRPITKIMCSLGVYDFDSKCFHKFNPTTDQKYAVPFSGSVQSCQLWNSYSTALNYLDVYTQAWILNVFLYQKLDINNKAYYRISEYNTGRCILFGDGGTILADQSCDTIQLNGIYIFPICFYSQDIPQLEPRYKDQNIPLQLAQIRVYGQSGPPINGLPAPCYCFATWTGDVCDDKTCPAPSTIYNLSPAELTDEISFWRKCYNNGKCYEENVLTCKCNYPYGPDAALLTSMPLLSQFNQTPCACPASPMIDTQQFVINDILYETPFSIMNVPCGGINHGTCSVSSNSTNEGICVCTQRPNVLNGGILEDAFDGKACTCVRPIIPYLGITNDGDEIVAEFCNNHGICAPFGETISNTYGNIYSIQLGTKGCICDNGYAGTACTCQAPLNLIYSLHVQELIVQQNIFYYYDLGIQKQILYINSSCQPYITNTVPQNASDICTFNGTILLYQCTFSNVYYRYVFWQGENPSCIYQVYSDYYPPCGKNGTTSPFAGTFYQIASYRSSFKYLLQQDAFYYASYG